MYQQQITGKEVLEKLVSYLKDEVKFTTTTLRKHRKNWESVIKFAQERNIVLDLSDADSLQRFAYRLALDGKELLESNHSLPYSFQLIQEYVKYGEIYSTISTTKLTGPISDEIIGYLSIKKREHLRVATYREYELQLSRFLCFLHGQEIEKVTDITAGIVQLYIMGLKPEHKSNAYIAILMVKRFLHWLYENHLIQQNIAIRIPSAKIVNQPNLPSVYSKEEVSRLLASVDRGNATGKRDYLVLVLASYLGMRSSDICNLRFENIDWESSCINIVQIKTDQPLTLPLLPEVGNAIIDYLKHGRPQSGDTHVLLNISSPFSPMQTSMIYQVATQAFRRAGIDISNRRHGAHSLRHSLASRMLEGQTAMPIISEALGHTETNSTMYYLRVDITSLKSCQMETIPVSEQFYLQFV